MTERTIRLGRARYPLVLPSLRDSRLHVAAVIVSIHVLGQTVLDFGVSIPQILAAIGTCFLIELSWVFRNQRRVVWPASAMLTGSGVALILRAVGTEPGDHFGFDGWYFFAGISGAAILTKYLIRYRGTHVFNPSNVALVVAFLLLGEARIEPLDFWWRPLDVWMMLAYGVIVAGGVLVTRRIGLLGLVAAFLVSLAAGLALLSGPGHCISARWSLLPVCDGHFWWIVMTSPETLIFMFFMISDPRTIPVGRVARLWFGGVLGVVCTILMAPATTEFGAKVGLLGGLTACSVGLLLGRVLAHSGVHPERWLPAHGSTKLALANVTIVLAGTAIVVAGLPARTTEVVEVAAPLDAIEAIPSVDPSSLPLVELTDDGVALLAAWWHEGEGFDTAAAAGPVQAVAASLVWCLQVEALALTERDSELLGSVAAGARLQELQTMIDASVGGVRVVPQYQFDTLRLVVVRTGPQGPAEPAFEVTGTRTDVMLATSGQEIERRSTPLETTFVLQGTASGRWLVSDEQKSASP